MKCLDCGYNISSDEIGEHEGHEVVGGFFEDKITTEFVEREMLKLLVENKAEGKINKEVR